MNKISKNVLKKRVTFSYQRIIISIRVIQINVSIYKGVPMNFIANKKYNEKISNKKINSRKVSVIIIMLYREMKKAEKLIKCSVRIFIWVMLFLEIYKIGYKNKDNKRKLTRIMKAIIRDREMEKVCNVVLSLSQNFSILLYHFKFAYFSIK